MNRSMITAWFAGVLACATALHPAAAADSVMTKDGVRYACTGVGAESRDDPRWREFAAKVVFAASNGGYLADVNTRVADGQGRTVLETRDCGPWLLLDVPQGSYRINATAHDAAGRYYESEATMTVGGSGQSETIVRFPQIAG